MNYIVLEAVPKSTIFGNIIVASGAFIILLVLVKKFAWGNITAILDARAKQISDDIDDAKKAKARAEQLAEERQTALDSSREEAGKIITQAQESARVSKDKMIADAQEEASMLKNRAQDEITHAKKEALSSVKGEVADISVQIAEKLIGKSLDKQAQSDLIDRYLAKLGE